MQMESIQNYLPVVIVFLFKKSTEIDTDTTMFLGYWQKQTVQYSDLDGAPASYYSISENEERVVQRRTIPTASTAMSS